MNVPLLMYGTECILLWQTIQSVSGLALMSINMINHAKSACINVATLQPPGNIWIMLFHTFINCAYFAVTFLKKQFSVCKVLSIIANSTQKKTVTSNGWDLWWIQKRSNISKVHFLRFAYLISVGMASRLPWVLCIQRMRYIASYIQQLFFNSVWTRLVLVLCLR